MVVGKLDKKSILYFGIVILVALISLFLVWHFSRMPKMKETLSLSAKEIHKKILKRQKEKTIEGLFQKTIGGMGDDEGHSIQQTSDGGYVITGYTDSYGRGDYDIFLIKLDSSGNVSWAKTIGLPLLNWDFAYSIHQTSDGGYVITGATVNYEGNLLFVIKLDSSGNASWAKKIAGPNWDWTDGRSIQQTSDGGYVITGETRNYRPGSEDVFVIKLDSSGNLSWAKTIGGSSDDEGYSIQQTSDGGYVITGDTKSYGAGKSDIFVIKLDSSGNISGCSSIGSASPTVLSPSPSVFSPTLSSSSVSLPVSPHFFPTPIVNSRSPSTTSQCSPN